MTKRISLVLACILLLSLVLGGCGGAAANTPSAPASDAPTTAPETAAPEKPESNDPAPAPEAAEDWGDLTPENPKELIYAIASKSNTLGAEFCKWWTDQVNERSGGRIEVKLYTDAQLYDSAQLAEAVMSGSIDLMCDGTANTWPTFVPVFSLTEAWFLWNSRDTIYSNLQEYKDLLMPIWEEDIGVKALNLVDRGGGGFCTKALVTAPEDLAGQQMRGPNSTDWEAMTLLGATPVQMSASEQWDALSKGTLTGMRGNYTNMVTYGIYDSCKYAYLDVTNSIFVNIMNLDYFNSLPSAAQDVILEVSAEMEERSFTEMAAYEVDQLAILEENGVALYHPDEENVAAWREALQPYYDSIMEKAADAGYGAEADKFMEITNG